MNRQKKQFIALLIVLILCVAAYGLVMLYNKRTQKNKEDSEEAAKIALTDYSTEDVTAFSYVLDGVTLSFTKDGDEWSYDADTSINISASAVESLLSSASSMTAAEKVENPQDKADYGFDEPSNTITITTKAGTTTLYIGASNDMLSQYYAMKEGDDSIYLVDSATATIFNKTLDSLTETSTEDTGTEDVSTEDTEDAENAEDAEDTKDTEDTEEADTGEHGTEE